MDNISVRQHIELNKPIQIVFYEHNDDINSLIKFVLDSLLDKFGQSHLAHVVYGCVKELIVNATKANLKRAFFQKHNWDIYDMGHYATGLPRFKTMIERNEYRQYYEELRNLDLWVMFYVDYNENGIKIEIINNSPIIPIEETRIRMKLKLAMVYKNLFDFYNQERDESEGAGMGIALLINLLSHAGIDPNLFRIWSREESTVARLEIPFNSDYIPERESKS